ncbi:MULTISPECIES: vitamin K epoxide reductase family protein [Desulfosediminicola]|uniref:vitamin K epoxide reductase family protein n=1 Tax=Desulfosediminicola TaxID=2886823 RepID=UPI0010ABBEC7|nr:vitamin K epoxide reductase family protein [Desulfosediminicola ganghwensis]
MPKLINLQLLLALGGAILAAIQTLLVLLQGDLLCLSEGCEVVEQLTTVSPVVFNSVGTLYFLVLFLTLRLGARGARGWLGFSRLLLLAGIAAEGVLISFQHYIAEIFCSYCLIIFSIIALLNIFMGWRQLMSALAAFIAVLLAFSSLQFTSRSQLEINGLENGVYGRLERQSDSKSLYFFFSSSCPHCEEVIETIDENFSCSLNFNPIDELKSAPYEEIVQAENYTPRINRNYLQVNGINEIPVLMIQDKSEVRLLRGKYTILNYLEENCRRVEAVEGPGMSMSAPLTGGSDDSPQLPSVTLPGQLLPEMRIPGAGEGDESCSVDELCEPEPAEGVQGQNN